MSLSSSSINAYIYFRLITGNLSLWFNCHQRNFWFIKMGKKIYCNLMQALGLQNNRNSYFSIAGNHLQDTAGVRCPAMIQRIAGSKYYWHNWLVINIFSLTGCWRQSPPSEDICYRLLGDYCSRCSSSCSSEDICYRKFGDYCSRCWTSTESINR